MARREELTDEQWKIVERLIPEPPKRDDGKGRPRRDDRQVLNGILWILRSGARWRDMPGRFPSHGTCHRRFQEWVRSGVFRQIVEALSEDLRTRGKLDLSECFIDATFVIAKKGALPSARPSGAKVRSSWQWQTALALLSPSSRRLLARMKSPLLKTLSNSASPRMLPND
jgi:transposase